MIADTAQSMTKAFISVFEELTKRIVCFFHVKKAIEYRLALVKNKEQIIHDIDILQACPYEKSEDFLFIAKLAIKKWNSYK